MNRWMERKKEEDEEEGRRRDKEDAGCEEVETVTISGAGSGACPREDQAQKDAAGPGSRCQSQTYFPEEPRT